MSEPSALAALGAAAEAVRQQLRAAAFDLVAVQQLAAFIDAQPAFSSEQERQGVVTALGCFLGECLVQTYGGTWAQGPDGTTGVGISQHSFFNPFFRVSEHLRQGVAESVTVFFASIPIHLENQGRRHRIT